MDSNDVRALVGTELPVGAYRIDPATHARAVSAVHAGDYAFEVAHPMYGHLAPHCGMGWTLEQLFEVVGADLDSGVLFGEADLTYLTPIVIDHPYEVRAHISAVDRKTGAATGVFDLITLHLELVSAAGEVAVISRETYVFPRPDQRVAS